MFACTRTVVRLQLKLFLGKQLFYTYCIIEGENALSGVSEMNVTIGQIQFGTSPKLFFGRDFFKNQTSSQNYTSCWSQLSDHIR